jgi:predicted transcriptional regulator
MHMKTEIISVRVSDDLKKAVEKAAAADDRTTASLVQKILRDTLKKAGFLK